MREFYLNERVERLEAENEALKDRLAALETALSAWLPESDEEEIEFDSNGVPRRTGEDALQEWEADAT